MNLRKTLLMITLFAGSCALAQTVPAVPGEYQDLYSLLDKKISAFDAKVGQEWDGKRADVQYGAELLTANCNRGQQLLTSRTREGIMLELTRLQSLGLRSVTVCIGFPLLYKPFLEFNGDPEDYAKFVDFYRGVAAEVHRRNMKLVVESSVLFPGVYSQNSGLKLAEYYQRLSPQELLKGRADVVETIFREVQPDFLNLGSEPDTQSRLTGQRDVATPEGYADQVTFLVKKLRAAGAGKTLIGAGVGTWQRQGDLFLRKLCSTGIDYIDLHVYTVNYDMLDRAMTYADLAKSCGKPVAISEAWLQKERDSELGNIDSAVDPQIFARDSFSFWSPLDQKFLAAFVKFSQSRHLLFFSAYWSRHFWAYLDYSEAKDQPKAERMQAATRAAARALVNGTLSPTGAAYKKAISEAESKR